MYETLFTFDHRNFRECQRSYRGTRSQEYYQGDYAIEPGSQVDVRADRKVTGCYSIIRLRSRNRLFFRRALSHIRADATDVAVLWFVRRGGLSISHQGGQSLVKEGDFAITHSLTPFFMECQTDAESVHEVFHAVVPTHALRRFILAKVPTGFCTAADAPEFSVAQRVLADVFEDRGRISEHSSELLVDGALSVLSDALAGRELRRPVRKSLAEARVEDVLRFIELHFCDGGLTLAGVAKACGISTRYLSFLLELHGTTFSAMIWDKRLKAAAQWLRSPSSGGDYVSEIAYGVGFKSPAHFSRMFRRAFAMSPREYRCSTRGAA